MSESISELVKKLKGFLITDSPGKSEIYETRDISTPESRETRLQAPGAPATGGQVKPISDSLHCPYCGSTDFVRRGTRKKKLESVQLYLCKSCRKTFTPQITKGKHYPLDIVLDAVSIYNLGYNLEQTCKIVNSRNAKTPSPVIASEAKQSFPNRHAELVSASGQEIPKQVRDDGSEIALGRTPRDDGKIELQPSTLAAWVSEFEPLCRYFQMRPYVTKKYRPKDTVIRATLAHRQLYRYLYHRGKAGILVENEYKHRRFRPLLEFLELVPSECPHHYFTDPLPKLSGVEGKVPADVTLRASEAPLTFSKTAMIVRAKQNFATKLCEFVLQSVKDRKNRHEALQKFMLANDSVTVACEVPVYLTRDDIEHMKTQLGFEIYKKDNLKMDKLDVLDTESLNSRNLDRDTKNSKNQDQENPKSEILNSKQIQNSNDQKDSGVSGPPDPQNDVILACPESLPKLITGHIDILQIRNGLIHILDYKPKAEKERPIEQLTLYAMALSRLTGLRLFEFKCAWFDEKDYFEFYPLHVLHKTKKARRRKKVATKEGIYLVNKEEQKIKNLRPI